MREKSITIEKTIKSKTSYTETKILLSVFPLHAQFTLYSHTFPFNAPFQCFPFKNSATRNTTTILPPLLYSLLQEATIGLLQDLIVVRLERQPTFLRLANLFIAKFGLVFGDEGLLMPTAIRGRIDEQLSMACGRKERDRQLLLAGVSEMMRAVARDVGAHTSFVERQEPEGGGVDGFADLGCRRMSAQFERNERAAQQELGRRIP